MQQFHIRMWDETGANNVTSGFRVQTDFRDETPSFALLRILAVLENCEIQKLPPLNDHLDPRAFNRLLTSAAEADQEVAVAVDIEDYTAVARDDGSIIVQEDHSSDEDVEN